MHGAAGTGTDPPRPSTSRAAAPSVDAMVCEDGLLVPVAQRRTPRIAVSQRGGQAHGVPTRVALAAVLLVKAHVWPSWGRGGRGLRKNLDPGRH